MSKVYKSDGTNIVLSYAFPSTLISQRCFLRVWGVAKYILMDRKTAIDLFHIVCAHAYIGHVARYFSIIGETLQRWGKRILSH